MHAVKFDRRLCALVVLFGLEAGLAGCGGSFLGGSSGDGRGAATHFLTELREGRLEPAWQGTTSEFKSLMGLENLRDCVKTHPALKNSAEYVEARDATRNGKSMVEHVFRAEARVRGKAVESTVKVLVAAGGGSWSVEHLSVE